MKNRMLQILLLSIALCFSNITLAQQQASVLSESYRTEAITALNKLMSDFYVFPDVAKETSQHLNKKLEEGYFNQFEDVESFANALTEEVQSINKDKHMRITKNRPYVAQSNTPERLIEERVDRLNRSRRNNLGVKSVEMLEGNVGYLDLRGFAGMERGKAKVDSYMKLMAEADAIIIDVSKNGGGSPHMVQYLCSFFFDEEVHLNSLYWREGDTTTDFYSLDVVGGKKMPDVPLFIITSSRTFSAAEEFSYNMQTRERATLVGETSGGGANPGGTRSINNDMTVFIPTGRAINPITKTNWEGVGVVPEIKVDIENAKEKAHELAKVAAEKFRKKSNEKMTKTLTKLNSELANYNASKSKKQVLELLEKSVENRYLEEYNINNLGYEYLMEHENQDVAELLFYANTTLYPDSPNAYDSYGEALMVKGDFEASIKNYQKAVDLAKINEDDNLNLYMENLQKVKEKYAASK